MGQKAKRHAGSHGQYSKNQRGRELMRKITKGKQNMVAGKDPRTVRVTVEGEVGDIQKMFWYWRRE